MGSEKPTDHLSGPFSWREQGQGNPVVFLHGLGGTRTAWGPQLRGLHQKFRCIAWDMPGYGKAKPLIPLTYAGIADRLVALLDLLEIERADLVGLSFGGMHALHTVLKHPSRVNRLILADSSPAFGMDGTTQEEWQRARLEPLDQGQTPADLAEPVIDAITASRLTGQIRRETIASFGEIPVEGFRAAVECLPTNDLRDRLADVIHETLVVVGELDEETPISYSKTITDGIPNSRLVVLPGAGHLSPAEAPDEFNDLIANFLAT